MSDDREHYRSTQINGSHQPSTSSAEWNNAPTRILVPSSRPSNSGHSHSRTAMFNPYGGTSANGFTVAPMKRVGPSIQPQHPPKKPRTEDTVKKPRTSDSFGSSPSNSGPFSSTGRPNLMPTAGKNTLREMETVTLEKKLMGTKSSPTAGSDSGDELNLKDSDVEAASSILAEVASKSRTVLSNDDGNTRSYATKDPASQTKLPHIDFHTKKGSRISLMKNRDGVLPSQIQPKKAATSRPRQPLDFGGKHDPLSQTSIKRATRHEAATQSTDEPVAKLEIQEAFFGLQEQDEDSIGSLSFLTDRFDGMRIAFETQKQTYFIKKDDIAWLLHNDNDKLFICISKESELFRALGKGGILPKETLVQAFPEHTLSLSFKRHALGGRAVTFLDDITPAGPPSNCKSPNALWETVSQRSKHKRRQKKQASPPITSRAAHQPTERPEKRPTSSPTKAVSRRASSELSDPPPEPKASRRGTIISQTNSTAPLPMESNTVRQSRKRISAPVITVQHQEGDDEVVLIYPSTGPGGVQVTRGEHNRLQPGEFLNDTLIEFALKYWLENLKASDPNLAEEIHVFSPFFYKKLKNKDVEAGYNAVRKWTSKVDIFKKRYLVVPINERLHWYLAIIMYPEHILHPSPAAASKASPLSPPKTRAQDREPSPEIIPESPHISDHSPFVSRANSPDRPLQEIRDVEMADPSPRRIEEPVEEPAEPMSPKTRTPSSPGVIEDILNVDDESIVSIPNERWKASQDQTWLLSFDSLGSKHPSVFTALRRYLAREAKDKKNIDIGDLPEARQAKVPSPVQPNYCDCGVYLIKTAETFLGRADDFFRQFLDDNDPLTPTHALWNAPSYPAKRDELFLTVHRLSNEWRISKGLTPFPEPVATQSQASVVDLINEDEPEPAPPVDPHEISDDNDSDIEITGEVTAPRGRARLTATKAAKLAERRRK